jgi:Ca2+-binding EF-hand superfamily protein
LDTSGPQQIKQMSRSSFKRDDPAGNAAPGVEPRFEEGKRGWMGLDNKVSFTAAKGIRNYRNEAKQIWKQLDANGDGTVCQVEIGEWFIKQNILCDMSEDDARDVIGRFFMDIDRDGNGTLDLEEFCTFYAKVEHEKNQMVHAARHHVTALPPSYVKFNKKKFNLDAIEKKLQDKIQQFTSQDSDRFRQVLTMFKTQVQRSHDHDNAKEQAMGVSKRQFGTILMWLGLFATREQANMLFERYDTNGDGVLTVHEFLTKARPQDYPARPVNFGETYSFRTAKRMYLGDTLNGRNPRPMTPSDHVYHVSEDTIAERVRFRMANKAGKGPHYEETPNAKRDLTSAFLFWDENNTGSVTRWQLGRVLGTLNISLGETHLEMLMDRYPTKKIGDANQEFNYHEFVDHVYPGKVKDPSMPHHLSLQLRTSGKYYKPKVLDFTKSLVALPSKSVHNSARASARASARDSARDSARSVAPGARLKPLSRGASRALSQTLANSQSTADLNLAATEMVPSARRQISIPGSGRVPASRGMSRSASQPQFVARAAQPTY